MMTCRTLSAMRASPVSSSTETLNGSGLPLKIFAIEANGPVLTGCMFLHFRCGTYLKSTHLAKAPLLPNPST
jgi:hypothetical protein